MKRSDAIKFRRQIERDGQSKTDTEALDAMLYYPVWAAWNPYEVGARVRHNGALYKCLQAHTSQDSWQPDVAASLWAAVLPGQDNTGVGEWVQPNSTNPYSNGDKVLHNGTAWVSNIDNNVWEPGVYGWTEA